MSDDVDCLLDQLNSLHLSPSTQSSLPQKRTVLAPIQQTNIQTSNTDSAFSNQAAKASYPASETLGDENTAPLFPAHPRSERDQFDTIRELDEKERWCDRNAVITALDHKQNRSLVAGIIDELIDQLPLGGEDTPAKEQDKAVDNTSTDEANDSSSLIPRLAPVHFPTDSPQFDPLVGLKGEEEAQQTLNNTFCVEQGSTLNETFEVHEGETTPSCLLNVTVDLGPAESEVNVEEGKATTTLNSTFSLISTTLPVEGEEHDSIDKSEAAHCDETVTETLSAADLDNCQPSADFVTNQPPADSVINQPLEKVEAEEKADRLGGVGQLANSPIKVDDTSNIPPIKAESQIGFPAEEQPVNASTALNTEVSKMAEDEIPIPRGAYTINWDEIDEFADPFAMSKPPGAKKGLANSPPIRSNDTPPSFAVKVNDGQPAAPAVDVETSAEGKTTPEEKTTPEGQTTPKGQMTPEGQTTPERKTTPEGKATSEVDKTREVEAKGDEQPPKKSSAVKKKRAPGKGSSKFAEFKKKQASKMKSGGEGDGVDLVVAVPPPVSLTTQPATEDVPDAPPAASYDFDNCADPFGSKNKMASSPPIRAQPAADVDFENVTDPFGTKSKVPNSPPPVSAAPPTQFADALKCEPVEDCKQSPVVSPFMSSKELSSPAALKEPTDSLSRDLPSSATNASQEDEFVDAVDELPMDTFQPAVPEMFNTTADLGILDTAARMKPNFRESALARQSLFQKFDPLVGTASPPQAAAAPDNVEESVYLMGDETVVESDKVDHLLDITINSSPHQPPAFTQDEMDERLRQQELQYEQKVLTLSRQVSELEQELDAAKAVNSEYGLRLENLLIEREESGTASQDAINAVKAERDKHAEDLEFVSSSFSDIHQRYDKQREVITKLREDEELLKRANREDRLAMEGYIKRLEEMKEEFNSKLSAAHAQLQQAKNSKQADDMRVEMSKRKAELTIESLTQQLNQKVAENEELTKICENLIQMKQGDNS